MHYQPENDTVFADEFYGIDFNGPINMADDGVEPIQIPQLLNDNDEAQLLRQIDVMGSSDSFGVDIFVNALYIANTINHNRN